MADETHKDQEETPRQDSDPKSYVRTPKPKGFRQRWRALTIGNQITVAATVVIAIANLIYAILAGFQLGAMQAQLFEMKSGGQATDKIILQALKQARATRDLAAAAKAQSEQAEAQTAKMDESITQLTEQATATKNLATEANRQLEIMQTQTRPWVGISAGVSIDGVDLVPNTFGGPDAMAFVTRLTYMLENSGSSPAHRVSAAFSPVIFNDPTPPTTWTNANCSLGGTFFILPRSAIQHTTTARIAVTLDRIQIVWMAACIVYQDGIGGPVHHTRMLLRSINSDTAVLLTAAGRSVNYFPIVGFDLWDSEAD